MSLQNSLKIFAVCLTSQKKYKAYAVYNGEQLIVTHMQPITGLFNTWREPLIKEIEENKAKDFIVLIEEKTDYVARHGIQYLLEDLNDESRSNYFDALDWYFALNDMGNVILAQELQQFVIRSGGESQAVEKTQDDKGRPVYKVDWSRFHGGYRTILLCVVAALYEPLSERFLKDMYPMMENQEDEHPANRWAQIFKDRGTALEAELMKARGVFEDVK